MLRKGYPRKMLQEPEGYECAVRKQAVQWQVRSPHTLGA